MVPNSCSLEKSLFNPFSMEDILLHKNSHPDKQFYNDSDKFTTLHILHLMRLTTSNKTTITFVYFTRTIDL